MKNILIIMGNHSPVPSSVSNCISPLVNKMSEFYNVDILTDRKNVNVAKHQLQGKINIYRIDDYRTMNTICLNELSGIDSVYALKMVTRIFASILKLFYYIKYVLFAKEKETGGWEVSRVYERFRELDKKRNYDSVISISLPFQSHYIAELIKDTKGDKIKWIVFEFDPFTLNKEIKSSKRHRRRMEIDEKRILKKCDSIFLTPELYEVYIKQEFIQLSSKVNLLPYANLEKIEYDNNKVNRSFMKDDKINCLFTGILYDTIRNPSAVIGLFSKIDKEIQLSMMTNFSLEKFKEYSSTDYVPTVIPFQNRDTALFNIMNSNILVNIGNTVEFQVPGKIFEYMSTGKPIIHFSKIRNDPALKYLSRYPIVLIINEWEIHRIDYIEEIEKFCNNNKNHTLTLKEVEDSLGEYSGNAVQYKFINTIKEMLGDK